MNCQYQLGKLGHKIQIEDSEIVPSNCLFSTRRAVSSNHSAHFHLSICAQKKERPVDNSRPKKRFEIRDSHRLASNSKNFALVIKQTMHADILKRMRTMHSKMDRWEKLPVLQAICYVRRPPLKLPIVDYFFSHT